MSCPIKVNSNTFELKVYTSCYCVLYLLCVSCLLVNTLKHEGSYKLWQLVISANLFWNCFNEVAIYRKTQLTLPLQMFVF